MPHSTASNSAKLMCLSSCTSCSQLASSATGSLLSTATVVTNKFAFTSTVTSCPLMHQVPCTGSACITFMKMSSISLSHPVVKAFTLHFSNMVATHNQPHTGKCPVNFPHTEKITWQVRTLRTIGSSLLWHHHSLPCSSQTLNLNTHVACLNCSGILLVKPNCSRCSLTMAAEHMLSLTMMSLI